MPRAKEQSQVWSELSQIITEELSNSNETDSDNDQRDLGMLDAEITQVLNWDTEDKEFEEEEWTENVSELFCILRVSTEQCWVIVNELNKVRLIWRFCFASCAL